MTEQETYDEVYTLFASLFDCASELSDEQHVCVMEAFNTFTEVRDDPPLGSCPLASGSAGYLVNRTANALGCLIDVTDDGRIALRYARAHALLMASLAA